MQGEGAFIRGYTGSEFILGGRMALGPSDDVQRDMVLGKELYLEIKRIEGVVLGLGVDSTDGLPPAVYTTQDVKNGVYPNPPSSHYDNGESSDEEGRHRRRCVVFGVWQLAVVVCGGGVAHPRPHIHPHSNTHHPTTTSNPRQLPQQRERPLRRHPPRPRAGARPRRGHGGKPRDARAPGHGVAPRADGVRGPHGPAHCGRAPGDGYRAEQRDGHGRVRVGVFGGRGGHHVGMIKEQ